MSQHKAASVAAVGVFVALAAAFLRQRRSKTGSSSTDKRHQISVVGDAFCDVVVGGVNHLPEWGTDALTDTPIALTPGGSACNTVLQLASLLRLFPLRSSLSNTHPNIVLHTALGNDFFGSFMRSKIAELAQGQDVQVSTASTSPSFSSSSSSSCSSSATGRESNTTCTSTPTTTTGVCICLSGAIDRAFITHRGVVSTFNKSHLDLPSLYNSCFIHIAGFYNCPSLWPALPGVLRECRKRGIVTSMSPQYDANGEWGGGLEEIFPWLDLLLLNEMEASAIEKGMRRREEGGKMEKEEEEGEGEEKEERAVEEAARYFVERGVRHVIVTMGERGAYALIEEEGKEGKDSEGRWRRREMWQACPRKEMVDTTGAGDSFNAGVLYRLVEGLMKREEGGREGGGKKEEDAWKEVLRMGCAMGSHSVTKVGASAPPRDREEILDNLKEIG